MKRIIFLSLVISTISFYNPTTAQESVTMGAGYANDVYYSMEDGIVEVVERAGWDIGFYTSPWSAAIITNGGMGVELYTYPNGDTTSWLNIDTTGLSTWPVLFNGEDLWENGAFNRNSGVHPDYGWGVYNSITHNVVGDSLYIIKLADGTFKQVWIVEKISIENKYVIRYADLDNSSQKEKTLDIQNWQGMNFVYFDFESADLTEREPDTDEWDLLFTKYQAMQPQGVPYPVIGVLNNTISSANRFHPVTLDFNDWYSQPWDTAKAVIGYNWKWFDLSAFQWNLEDSLLFFVNAPNGSVYKMYFTHFAGTSSGVIEFELEEVSLLDIEAPEDIDVEIGLLPNPATNSVTVAWSMDLHENAAVRVFDLTGKEVISRRLNADRMAEGNVKIDISSLHDGMYIVSVVSGGSVINEKLIVR